MPTICGTVSIGTWPHEVISEDTAVEVKFGVTFDCVPAIVVQLAAIDAASANHKRISTWVSDESCEGFRLHTRTWDGSITWNVKVSWIASSEPCSVQMGTQWFGDWPRHDVAEQEVRRVDFARPSPCVPDVAVGMAMIDAQGDQNLRIMSHSRSAKSTGFELSCGSKRPSTTWGIRLSWVASASPAALQCGCQEMGSNSDPIVEGASRRIKVSFGRAFDRPPAVALFLSGVDADFSKPTRIDTWADNVSSECFDLNVRSWEDSVLWFVKVAWVATPACATRSTVSCPILHHPPAEYVVEGEPLGQGWWGVTHKARHQVDGQLYAVKTCKHSYRQHQALLREELQNLAKLPVHCNLLRYHTCILQSDQLHIVTEYLDAFKMSEVIPAPDGEFPCKHATATILRWMAQLTDGLEHMHKIGMLHRDLHGDNILIEKDVNGSPSESPRAVRIIDFGVAKVQDIFKPRQMSQQAGCWQYFSPERRRGEEFDDKDDVWATGCHLIELVSGHRIRKRKGCGLDGVDFPLCPAIVAKAVQECGKNRCRTVAESIFVPFRHRRPSAAAVRAQILGMLSFVPGKRAGPSGGSGCR